MWAKEMNVPSNLSSKIGDNNAVLATTVTDTDVKKIGAVAGFSTSIKKNCVTICYGKRRPTESQGPLPPYRVQSVDAFQNETSTS